MKKLRIAHVRPMVYFDNRLLHATWPLKPWGVRRAFVIFGTNEE